MRDWKRADERIKVHLFSNATEFDYWFSNNCPNCRFFRPDENVEGRAGCPILDMVYDSTVGSLPLPFARLFMQADDTEAEEAHMDSGTVCPGYQPHLKPSIRKPDTSHLVPTDQDKWLRHA